MKLIQILALTTAMAAMASGQSTGANNAKPGGQQPGAAPAKSPAVAAKPAAASKPTPAARKAGPAVSAKSKQAPAKPGGRQTVSAKPTGTAVAPATKPGAPAAKPVVTTGSLPAKEKPGAAAHKSGPPAQAVSAKSRERAKPAPKPAARAVAAKKTSGKPKVAASKPAKPSVARVEGAPKPEPKPRTPAKLLGAAGRRDPFVSPIRSASAISPTASCTSGKRCLAIPELVLHGTVRDISGKMMAVVSTSNRRTYTLRENDQVFNGSVEKITSDSIVFREYVKDPLGRETAREVVKKMGPTS